MSRAREGCNAMITPTYLFHASNQLARSDTTFPERLEGCLSWRFSGMVSLSNDMYSPRAILVEYFSGRGGQHDTASRCSFDFVREGRRSFRLV